MVSILEYDQKLEEKKLRKAEYEAGLENGRSEGIESILQSIWKSGYSPEKIAEMTGRSTEEVKRILKAD